MHRVATFLIIFCLTSSLFNNSIASADEPFLSPLYYGEGEFVKGPATLGGFIFTIPGLTLGLITGSMGYIVGLPCSKEKEFMNFMTGCSVLGFMFTGSTIVGSPFYVTKKHFMIFQNGL